MFFIGNAQNKTRDFINQITKDNKKHESHQQEFIKFLENNYKETQDIWYIKILQKYKEIIGESDDNNTRI